MLIIFNSVAPSPVVDVSIKEMPETEIVAPRKEDEELAHRNKIEKAARAYFNDTPVLAEIARCESRFRQLNIKSGEVIRGEVNSQDVGVMQINERFHLKASQELGYNIYSLEGNLAYARHLYEQEGTKPWNSSKPCWGKSLRSAELALK